MHMIRHDHERMDLHASLLTLRLQHGQHQFCAALT